MFKSLVTESNTKVNLTSIETSLREKLCQLAGGCDECFTWSRIPTPSSTAYF
ncbi:hypothetical protein MPTK1_8g16220 [Marchantia polymorpha subsp. ruderalis]